MKALYGMLWVWPDISPEGVEVSERVVPAAIPEMADDNFGGEWYMRDLPYGFDTLVENLVGEAITVMRVSSAVVFDALMKA